MKDSLSASDQVTVLVFKDNLPSRTLQVPLRWFTRFGVLIGTLVALTLVATVLAIRYYAISKKGDAHQVTKLEREIETLRQSYETLRAENTKLVAPTQEPRTEGTPSGETTPSTPSGPVSSTLFTAIPRKPGMGATLPDTATLPFQLTPPKFEWKEDILQLQFAIQYTRGDGGNQQGRIVVLGRGPELLIAYPDGVLNPAGSPTLIAPERGEYFSVSRYREGIVELGPVASQDSIRELEILIFNTSGELLLAERIMPKKPAVGKPVPKPPATATPGATQ